MTIDAILNDIKKAKTAKFDETIEVHVNLEMDSKQAAIRTTVSLPHGTGREVRVFVVDEDNVADFISKTESGNLKPKTSYDLLVASPSVMPKFSKVAKILGPQGVMPNPKNGTISPHPKEAAVELSKGKIELKTEKDAPIMHTVIGKKSFEQKALLENYNAVLETIKNSLPAKALIKSIFVSSTMGKSYKVEG